MTNSTFFFSYLITLLVCLGVTIGLLFLFRNGLRKFYKNLAGEGPIADFFVKLTNLVILLAGLSAALTGNYNTKEANWLTLTWDMANQLKESLNRLFVTFIILSVAFLIIQLMLKRSKK